MLKTHYFLIILLHFTIILRLFTFIESVQWNYYIMVYHCAFLPNSTQTSH